MVSKILAAIPVAASAFSAIYAGIMSIDELLFLPFCIGDLIAFIILCDYYKNIVKDFENLNNIL